MMNTEKKVILIGAIITVLFLVGAIFLLSKGEDVNVPEDQIVTRKGLHWHPRIIVSIKGEKQEIPANLGIGGPVHRSIHTHDTDNKEGVIHVEKQGVVIKSDTKLAGFFQVWGKDFNSNCVFDKCNGSESTVKMTVNGEKNTEFENYLMKDGDKIEIRYE